MSEKKATPEPVRDPFPEDLLNTSQRQLLKGDDKAKNVEDFNESMFSGKSATKPLVTQSVEKKSLSDISLGSNMQRAFQAALLRSQPIRNLKQLKQMEIQRRSILIYGHKDMNDFLQEMTTKKQAKGEADVIAQEYQVKKKEKHWKQYFLIADDGKFMKVWDFVIFAVVIYSCLTTAYQIAFGPSSNKLYNYLDQIVTYSYTIDIGLKFLRQPSDDKQAGHLKIAKAYTYSGILFIDILATFPFNDIISKNYMPEEVGRVFKLLRLSKLPKVFEVIQYAKCKPIIDFFWQTKARKRSEVVQIRITCTSYFIVIRLIVVTAMVVYYFAIIWYFVANQVNESYGYKEKTFLTEFLNDFSVKQTNERLVASMYFIMTTISTVGYGDKYATSDPEKITAIVFMFLGTLIFAVTLGIFGSIIEGQTDDGDSLSLELHEWTTMLRRFRHNNPLPTSLYHQINNHFKHFWQNNRIASLQDDNGYHTRMPPGIKRGLIIHYLFDDVFYNFRNFFQPKAEDSKFLYTVAFGLKPRKFFAKKDENIIYEEEEEVSEMYFIINGDVGIGYTIYMTPMDSKNYRLTYFKGPEDYFGAFYLTQNLKSEFLYLAYTDVEAFSLSKKFMMRKIFTKFPAIFKRIKHDAQIGYRNTLRPEVLKHKQASFDQLNLRTTYDQLKLKEKNKAGPISEMPLYNAELSSNLFQHQFAERVSMITSMAKQSEEGLNDFLQVINSDFKDMFIHISEMQMNLKVLRAEIEHHREINNVQAIKLGLANPNDRLIMDSEMQDITSSIHLPMKKGDVVSSNENLAKDKKEE